MDNNVEIFQGEDKQWYFHIKAKNGLVVAQSEGYKDKRNALKGVAAAEAAFAPPPPDPIDPDTPPIVAFAKRYSPLMAKWQPGITSVVAERNQVTLVEILLRAAEEGWTITPPAELNPEPVTTTGATPMVEKASTGRRRKAAE